MDPLPESHVDEMLRWIAFERDAAWTTKLAIHRLARRDDIAHFGACLREHDRHAHELTQLLRAADPRLEAPREPMFATPEPHVIGALLDGESILEAMTRIEEARIARYEGHPRRGDDPRRILDALLERHLNDARARLSWLRDRREAQRAPREAVA